MITQSKRLAELEADYDRTAYAGMSPVEALQRFAALWALARIVQPSLGSDWREDLAPDLAVARAVNGLPPAA